METVEVSCRDQASVDSLQSWMDNHGQYVKRLQVSPWPKPVSLALLACRHLQQLDLEWIKLVVMAMGPNSSNSHGSGHPVALTTLTKLHLSCCTVAGGLVGLSVLTALKELKVDGQSCFPGSLFQHYRLLTRLVLTSGDVTDLHFISCLVSLQQLKGGTDSIPNITCGLLPGGLPASLRVLELCPIVMDPVVLSGLTNMRDLRLEGSSKQAYQNDFELEGGSAVQLLDAIAAMQQLEELILFGIRCDWPTASFAAYSSLTASSNLTCLWLDDCRLPAGALERMLPPAGVLYEFAMLEYNNGPEYAIIPWHSEDVDMLLMHCPALRWVNFGLQSSDDLDRLTRLSALTKLDASFAEAEPVGSITDTATKFTRLRDLRLIIAAPGEKTALLPLTALRQLTKLEVQAWYDYTSDWGDIYLSSYEQPPDVWLELLKRCAEHPGCQTTIVQNLADQQAQLQQQATQLQQQQVQLAEQQQQATGRASALSAATAAHDEAAAARAEAAAARAQASAAEAGASAARAEAAAVRADAAELRADAAELRDQLAALQAAVQHLVHPQATE